MIAVIRWAVIVLISLYVLISLGIPVRALSYALTGQDDATMAEPMIALIHSMSLLQIGVWFAALAAYCFGAVLLVLRNARALIVTATAAVLDIGQWASLKYGGTAYDAAFSSGQQAFDYSLFGFLALILGTIVLLRRLGELR